jgi:transcriptional regulator with XRE-family HTH domain
MDTSHLPESFRGLLLRHRRRTGLIQRDLAALVGVSLRSVQDWEAGVTLPTAERLQGLTRALLNAGGLTPGRESSEARELRTAAAREGPRMHTLFDEEWFARLLAARASPISAQARNTRHTVPAAGPGTGGAEACAVLGRSA